MADDLSTIKEEENSEAEETREAIFKCRLCGTSKRLDEMRVLDRFFPPIVACADCERKMR